MSIVRQAIVTKYIPPTNTKGSRIKAFCDRGSIIVPTDHSLNLNKRHEAAAKALIAKFVREDQKQYGTKPENNPWNQGPLIAGGLPEKMKGGYLVFVFA